MIEINLLKLDKGTKLEWRTVTRGGKTFKQRFRVGKKDSTSPITEFETKIKGQDYETAGIFNDKGEFVSEKSGEKDNVKFLPAESVKFRGMTLTHNHPIGDSFSPTDLKFACVCEMKSIRVICRDHGKTFQIRAKDDQNLDWEAWKDTETEPGLGFLVETYDNDVRKDFRSRIYNGVMTIAEADGGHWQEVWKRVNEHTDKIIYEEV